MTYIPDVPLWCWCMQGEDAVFLSQPTHAFLCEPPVLALDGRFLAVGASETRWLDGRAACVARCQYQTRFVLEDRPTDLDHLDACLTPPVQCGHVARLDPRGLYFCHGHMHRYWHCYQCDAPLPHGDGGFCSQACQAACDALGSDD